MTSQLINQTPDVMYLAAGTHQFSLVSLAWIMGAAVLAPVISMLVRKKIPAVVLLLAFGVIIGPHMLKLAIFDDGISMISEMGLGMLFLLAGFEIEVKAVRSAQGQHAAVTWIVSFGITLVAGWAILGSSDLDLAATVALVLSSTALGTLVPILNEQGVMKKPVGKAVMVHGAMGELMPIFAMAILLSAHSTAKSALILLAFFGIAAVVAFVPSVTMRIMPVLRRTIWASDTPENQIIMRIALVSLAILMGVAATFDLDVALGAFAAGVIARQVVPNDFEARFASRLEVIGYGLLIPVFFVASGMKINVDAVTDNLWLVLAIVPAVWFTRGLPIFLHEMTGKTNSGLKRTKDRLQLGLYSATALPIVVAVTEVAESSDIISSGTAGVLVAGAGMTVLVYPLLGASLRSKKQKKEEKENAPV